jgi:hypothetical protein
VSLTHAKTFYMVTPAAAQKKYGAPKDGAAYLDIYKLPDDLQPHFAHVKLSGTNLIGLKRVYCNKDMHKPFEQGLRNLVARGKADELKTWDGAFNIRKMRGLTIASLHSWAIAFDINASENPLGKNPRLSKEFVGCFTDAGFDWGGDWERKDGMHFQLSKI